MKKICFICLLVLTGCAAPLTQTPETDIARMSREDICDAGTWNDEQSLAEQILNKRGMSCDAAKQLCYEAGLTPKSPQWPECFINAKSVIAQEAAARAANAAAASAMQANIQRSIQAVTPRTP